MRTDISRCLMLCAGMSLMLAVGGCDSLRQQLGLAKNAPDEFAVVSRAPLVLPPDFSLRPPRPGAARPQEQQPSVMAQSSLFDSAAGENGGGGSPAPAIPAAVTGGSIGRGAPSAGELALLNAAGAPKANPEIREIIDRETSTLAEKDRSFTDRLIFWQPAQPPGQVVDAREEAKRLRENAAAGVSATEGETAVIERRRRGLLEGIF